MRLGLLMATASLGLLMAGCGDSAKTTPAGSGKTKEKPDDKIAASLAKLSAEDRAAAEKQRDCPVSGQPLGSMGAPIKVTVKDRDVWLCCEGCKDKLTGEPDKYLIKLKDQ